MTNQNSYINLRVISLEPLETRYTKQWLDHIPLSIYNYCNEQRKKVVITNIVGKQIEDKTTPGAFLDFAGTNIWKSDQLLQIAELFRDNKVKPGDIFLYTDFWNPTVIQLRYMSSLLNIPIKIIGIAHAGNYDPQDFLSRLIGKEEWIKNAELSMFHCFDKLIFATQFHIDMFVDFFGLDREEEQFVRKHIVRSGFPMEYFPTLLNNFSKLEKKQQIVFPHRKSPEKQLDIFLDLAKALPEYNWVVCQDTKLTKDEYHTILGESKISFSANLQETLGLGQLESLFCNTFPLVPNRLSYIEMYSDFFKYDSAWTIDWDSYIENKPKLINRIKEIMNYSEKDYSKRLAEQKEYIIDNYINPDIMYSHLF